MANTTVTIRMDKELKEQAEELFSDLGMNMTTAFTIFAKSAVRQQKIPFEIERDPFYSEANMNRLRKAVADVESGKSILTEHELIEVADD